MKTRILLAFGLALGLTLSWSTLAAPDNAKRSKAKQIEVLQSWNGKLTDQALRRQAPTAGFVVDRESWTGLWQAWRKGEEVPVLDFEKQMVLVLTTSGPNSLGCAPTQDGQGNVRAVGMSTLIAGPGFGYLLLCVSKEGVKTVNGKPLPGVEVPPANPSESKPPRRQPGSVPGGTGRSSDDSVVASPPQPAGGTGEHPPTSAVSSLPAIKEIKQLKPQPGIFEAAKRKEPLVLRSEKDAGEYFAKEDLAKLAQQVDFKEQIVLVFAWRGSGQDRLEFAVAESFPEQVFFTLRPGRTRDLRPHVRIFAIRASVKWSVK